MLDTARRAIVASEGVLAALRELKRSMMQHLFTYGPVPVHEAEHVSLKETEIGPVPEAWDVVPLGEVADVERGKFSHRPRNDPAFYGGNIPFIQTGDVSGSESEITSYSQTLNERGLAVSRLFPRETIVITIAANIGYTGVLGFDAAFPDSLVGITAKRVDTWYLEYYLQTQQRVMDSRASRGTQKNINLRFLRPWPVPVASHDQQQAITDDLGSVDSAIVAEADRKQALETLFQSLLHNLMTGRVRVPLETEPVEEVSS